MNYLEEEKWKILNMKRKPFSNLKKDEKWNFKDDFEQLNLKSRRFYEK